MSDYRVADTHDVALGSLTVLDPQPRSRGIQYTSVTYGGTGIPNKQAPYVELDWGILEDKSMYQSILTAFGLLNDDANDVTVYVRDGNFDYVRKNGKALKPFVPDDVDWSNFFPRNLTILVRNLEDPA